MQEVVPNRVEHLAPVEEDQNHEPTDGGTGFPGPMHCHAYVARRLGICRWHRCRPQALMIAVFPTESDLGRQLAPSQTSVVFAAVGSKPWLARLSRSRPVLVTASWPAVRSP